MEKPEEEKHREHHTSPPLPAWDSAGAAATQREAQDMGMRAARTWAAPGSSASYRTPRQPARVCSQVLPSPRPLSPQVPLELSRHPDPILPPGPLGQVCRLQAAQA